MQEGVIESGLTDTKVNNFIIDQVYPIEVIPISCILSGSRAYGLATDESDRDFLGIHMMDTWQCLEHPNFRQPLQVIRKNYSKDFKELEPGKKGGDISLGSFELWKFTDLWLKGSFVSYELLYMPVIHQQPEVAHLMATCREGLTNRVGKAAKGNAFHDWRKNKTNRKKTIMAYYRLLQAIHFLREGEWEWRADQLIESANLSDFSKELFQAYPERKNIPLDSAEVEVVNVEIDQILVDEVNRAMMVTRLPDQCPPEVLKEVLNFIRNARAQLI